MEWKQYDKASLCEFIKDHGLDPNRFIFAEDGDDEFDDVFYEDLCYGLVRSASANTGELEDLYYFEIIHQGMTWCRDSWCGPVKYIRAVMDIRGFE